MSELSNKEKIEYLKKVVSKQQKEIDELTKLVRGLTEGYSYIIERSKKIDDQMLEWTKQVTERVNNLTEILKSNSELNQE